MMTMKAAIVMLHEKEKLFLQFLSSFLTFLIYICKCSLNHCDEQSMNDEKFEISLMNSLTLMWQMHVAIFSLKTNYRKAHYIHDTSLTFNDEQSALIVPKLREIKKVIECCPSIEQADKLHCLSLLEQINSYYVQCDFVVVDADLHADPWLASPLKSQQQLLGRCNAGDD